MSTTQTRRMMTAHDDVPGTLTIKPDPDPTILTTQQLFHAIEALEKLIFTRLDAMDKAIILFNDNLTRVPTDTDKQVGHLKELQDEKFLSIQTQFKERDTRVEQTARDTKVAVDAALQAAEKAVGKQNESFALSITKSETATIKQIDQQSVLIATNTKGTDDKIADLKDRNSSLESRLDAFIATVTGHSKGTGDSWGILIGAAALIASIVAIAVGLVAFLKH